jgi:hypothetical protein
MIEALSCSVIANQTDAGTSTDAGGSRVAFSVAFHALATIV